MQQTFPKIVCLLLSSSARPNVKKNWLPLSWGPAFAMATSPLRLNRSREWNSSWEKRDRKENNFSKKLFFHSFGCSVTGDRSDIIYINMHIQKKRLKIFFWIQTVIIQDNNIILDNNPRNSMPELYLQAPTLSSKNYF